MPFHKLGSWQGIPVFLKSNFLSEVQYSLAIADPSTGFDLPFYASWLDEKNRWRIGASIEEFFQLLTGSIEAEQKRIIKKQQKAEEFEAQARTIFPQQEPWQMVLDRKQALDCYIDCAASAHSKEALQRLTQMRHHLLETAPKELTERPMPKNTAQFVRPPRNPNPQEETISTLQIEVERDGTQEQTIEEMARAIQQGHIVGSRAVVSFGNLKHIQNAKKRKKGKIAPTPLQPETVLTETKAAEDANLPVQPQPKTSSTKNKAAQLQATALWDLMTEESTPVLVAAPTSIGEAPEQLTLF